MKHVRNISAALIAILVIGCNDKANEQTTSVDSTTTSPKPEKPDQDVSDSADITNCYLFISGRDSYMLRLNPVLNGKMEFRNYQKDKSFGTVKGENTNDMIRLWYNFQSEGMNSVSEMYFKRSGDDLIRGLSAAPVVSNDTAYYGKISESDFDKGQTFRKVACSTFRFRDE